MRQQDERKQGLRLKKSVQNLVLSKFISNFAHRINNIYSYSWEETSTPLEKSKRLASYSV